MLIISPKHSCDTSFQKVYMKTPELVILTCLKCLLRGWKVLGGRVPKNPKPNSSSRMRSVDSPDSPGAHHGEIRQVAPSWSFLPMNLGGKTKRSLAPIKGVTLLQMMFLFWYWSCYMTWRKSTKDSLCMYIHIILKHFLKHIVLLPKTLRVVCTWCFSNKASSTYIYIYKYISNLLDIQGNC